MLGIDAALETPSEESVRKHHNKNGEDDIPIFKRCRLEKRALLTTSTRLLMRKEVRERVAVVNRRGLAPCDYFREEGFICRFYPPV